MSCLFFAGHMAMPDQSEKNSVCVHENTIKFLFFANNIKIIGLFYP